MQISFIMLLIPLFTIADNVEKILSSEDFNRDSKLPPQPSQCEFRNELVDDFYQSEQTGENYSFENLPKSEIVTDLRSKKYNNTINKNNISSVKSNISEPLNSTDILSELNQVNGSLDILRALLNEYSPTLEVDGIVTESSGIEGSMHRNDSLIYILKNPNDTRTVPSFLWRLFSTKSNRTRVNSDQKFTESYEIVEPLSLNSSHVNQIKLNVLNVSTSPVIKPHDNVVSKETLAVNGQNGSNSLPDGREASTSKPLSIGYHNQLVVNEEDFMKLSQHILTSLENIEDGITVLAKENSLISEEMRSMENLQDKFEKQHAKERNNFVGLLKLLFNMYQNTSHDLVSIQDMNKSIRNGLTDKNIYSTTENNVYNGGVIISGSRMSNETKFDNPGLSKTTQRNDYGVTSDNLKYQIVIIGTNENKTLSVLRDGLAGGSTSNIRGNTFDTVLENVVDVIKKGFPESQPIVVRYEVENEARDEEMVPKIINILKKKKAIS
ncbi:uncharacterized protein LOC111057512 [Nilaparvata lugens]|uniref:uncharacterized protein LOC111057512 n=1 Tax=Nilaparvata lugens TaxID=108931 RepID=UPI00193DBC14|nr:uncharacterized protein LOC111057512 [Nilaparvata lugens]